MRGIGGQHDKGDDGQEAQQAFGQEYAHDKRDGQQDLDDTNQIRAIITKASVDYKSLAHDPQVQALSKIKYRNGLRDAIYKLADELAEC